LTGTIFNIEEFAVHDGPGIRTVFFLKGCPLRCSWCHNPEGLSFEKQIIVNYSSCTGCEKCTEICINDECISCGNCIDTCPQHLRRIAGEQYDAGELSERLLRAGEILSKSGGGITFSGGEPLAQHEFLFDMISHLKPLHIAVETSGYSSSDVFREMTSITDLVIMDIKHADTEMHRKYTGQGNELIMENLAYLCSSSTDFIIRIPLIPGVNDTHANINDTAKLIEGAKHLNIVELLPYHMTAAVKYPMLGMTYSPGFDTNEPVRIWNEVFEQHHINYRVL
jgi:pyruvate formate lyase activating enzyme